MDYKTFSKKVNLKKSLYHIFPGSCGNGFVPAIIFVCKEYSNLKGKDFDQYFLSKGFSNCLNNIYKKPLETGQSLNVFVTNISKGIITCSLEFSKNDTVNILKIPNEKAAKRWPVDFSPLEGLIESLKSEE